MSWYNFYIDRFEKLSSSYGFFRMGIHHLYLFFNILKYKPNKVLEVGSGTSRMSVLVSLFIKKVVALDKDTKLINKAVNITNRPNVEFIIGDAFNLPFKDNSFDIVFSQGLLEHFTDNNIDKILKEKLRVSRMVIFSVPNYHYGKRDYGDERLMRKNEWDRILSDYKIISGYYGRNWSTFSIIMPVHYIAIIKKIELKLKERLSTYNGKA